MADNIVRTRYAPSPTGNMHVGNLRTALYEFLIARSSGGRFILRIEDTDQGRFVEGSTQIIYDNLSNVGITHDEGPDIGGPFGPYTQSERLHLYKPYAEQLVDNGFAYYCFCTRERLDTLKHPKCDADDDSSFSAGYDRNCRDLPGAEIEELKSRNIPYVIRQRMPFEGSTTFHDVVYGDITVENCELEDQILLKSDGFPTYNFANVIDDHLMNITHVVRGNEYLSSTPKYNLLYSAFGWDIPVYVHLPLILGKNPDGTISKLAKRHGSTALDDLLNDGYLPEAIVNYIALLGWSPKENVEIMSMDDLIRCFSIEGISKSPAIFDYDKLRWVNSQYITALSSDEFHKHALPYYNEVFGSKKPDLDKISSLLQPRLSHFSQIPGMISFISELPEYPPEFYIHKKMKTTMESSLDKLRDIYPVLQDLMMWDHDTIHSLLVQYAIDHEEKNGQIMWPIRTALSGIEVTPGGAVELLTILGKDESLRRIQVGIHLLETNL
ncbi:MAG: glutamate--tRNA ligase [Saccharofermentanales bacterium]